MKKISIVMPVYNGKEYIRESIESIISQTYPFWELIIVNDFGSNDGVVDIIKEYAQKDERIILVQNKKREGISESINIGLRLATGEYIARMDSDDISGPKRLETQLKYLEENTDIYLCGISPEYFGSKKLIWDLEKDPIQIKHNIFFYTPCVHPTIMFRRVVLDTYKIFYNKDFKATEDYDFFSRVVGIGNITNIVDKSLFKYRYYSNNATNKNYNLGIVLYSKVMKNSFKKYLNLDFTDEEINLLNPHISIKNTKGKDLIKKYLEIDSLMKRMLIAAANNKDFNIDNMFITLKSKYYELLNNTPFLYKSKFNVLNNSILANSKMVLQREEKTFNNDVLIIVDATDNIEYLFDTIVSILNQTYCNFNLNIITSNENLDEAKKIISIFKKEQISLFTKKNNENLDEIIDKLKNEEIKYISILKSGDIFYKNKLEKEYQLLEKNKNFDCICSRIRYINNEISKPIIYLTNKNKQFNGQIPFMIRNNSNSKKVYWLKDILITSYNYNKGLNKKYLRKELKFIDTKNQKKIGGFLMIRKILRPIYTKIIDILERRIEKDIGVDLKKVSEYREEIEELKSIYYGELKNRIPYYKGEKIRVVFMFQMPSFWPSTESVYNKIKDDKRFEIHFLLIKNDKEPSQSKGNEQFLQELNIDYKIASIEEIDKITPHIVFYQSPYDDWHRDESLYSSTLMQKGYRIIYIPYGLEISDEEYSLYLQYNLPFFSYCWKIFVASERIKENYIKYNYKLKNKVVATGLPKFDSLYNKSFTTHHNFKKGDKKNVLLKIHFPLTINTESGYALLTPETKVYTDFINSNYRKEEYNLFLMLHPKFYDNLTEKEKENFKNTIKKNNITVIEDADYREILYNIDAVICDRSSILVEIGGLDIPVLFMVNKFREEIGSSIFKELFDSYIKGTTTKDMFSFIDSVLKNEDTNKEKRNKAFKNCIPYYDGKASDRIVEEIIKSLEEEVKEK